MLRCLVDEGYIEEAPSSGIAKRRRGLSEASGNV